MFSWPHPAVARELVQRYFDFSAPTYRVLHRPTVIGWLARVQAEDRGEHLGAPPLPAAARAAVLMVFATASMFKLDMDGAMCDADDDGWRESEMYYIVAQDLLSVEDGPQRLESVQARFMTVLYQLSSSRANQAWFTHGTTVQLIMALGLHRKRTPTPDTKVSDLVVAECQKRVLWCSYTVDKYLSVIIGRPRLLQDEDIDQEYPSHVNDEDLSAHSITTRPARDCTMDAPIFHACLARVLARASKEQYAIQQLSAQQQIDASLARSKDIANWHAGLPPFISGAVQAGTLVPVFRRQLTVLRLAHYHATMFVTRPLLLRNYAKTLEDSYGLTYRSQLRNCVLAAKDATDLILSFVQDGQLFPAFWYSQYIAFNALSIIYIYVIQAVRRRIPSQILSAFEEQPFVIDDQTLFRLAESVQDHLAKATIRNAPAWKYSFILEGLRSEITGPDRSGFGQTLPEVQYHGGLGRTSVPSLSEPSSAAPSSRIAGSQLAEDSEHLRSSLAPTYSGMHGTSTFDHVTDTGLPGQKADGEYSHANFFYPEAERLLEGLSGNMGETEFGFEFWPQFDSLPLCE